MSKLLVSTSHALLSVDPDSATVNTVHTGKGLYYGIVRGNGIVYVACRNRMVSSDKPADEERGEILAFDPQLTLQNTISAPFPLRDMHGAAWSDNKLWVTCTRDNCVAIFDGNKWEKWHPLPEDVAADKDIHHYNTILFADDQICLLAHNNGDSEILHFDRVERTLLKRTALGQCAHNIWIENGQFYTCSSGTGSILGDRGLQLEIGGFLRGYASLSDGRRIVGVSTHAVRAARDQSRSNLLLMDQSWRLISDIQLGDNGMVLDVCVIP